MAATKVSLKLLIDKMEHRVIFAEAGKEFVDFLISILGLPVGTVIRLLRSQGMVGCLQNLYESIENLSDSYLQPGQNKSTLLMPIVHINGGPLLLPNVESSTSWNLYSCSTSKANNHGSSSSEGGYVKGVVTYMVMDDLKVRPMSIISGITLLNKLVKEIGALEEKVVHLGMDEGVKLLKASLLSNSVLTDVFLPKLEKKLAASRSNPDWRTSK
ncbi:hypothetical protein CFP56_013806 [Quercus suber]|uniref:DUF674 domain-containing protein n=1 Tax=Quercus suber TaxID=58331 RepID=A0AAW0M4D0_QUESU